MNRVGLTLAFVLLVTGCRTRVPDQPVMTPCEISRGTVSMLGSSRAELIAALGEPASVRSEEQPNRHVPGATDTMHYLTWEGLEVTVHEAPVVEREFLASVVATRRNTVPVSSWIGRNRDELVEAIGESIDAKGTASARWECFSELAPETITASFEDGAVVRVAVSYPID